MRSKTKFVMLDDRLEAIEKERALLDDAEKIFIKEGLKAEYLELRRDAKTHLQEAKRLIIKIEEIAPRIVAVKGWRMFFKSFEAVVIRYAKDHWTARNILFLSGEEENLLD